MSVSWKPTVLFEGQFLLTWTSYKVEIAGSSIVTQYVKFLVSATIVTLVYISTEESVLALSIDNLQVSYHICLIIYDQRTCEFVLYTNWQISDFKN